MGIKKDFNLEGQWALVTGASGHIGSQVCDYLAELGANLVIVDRNSTALLSLKERLLTGHKVEVVVLECDLESESSRRELRRQILEAELPLDILIHSAAFVGTSDLSGWGVPFQAQSLITWRRALEVNLTSVFHLVQLLEPLLAKSEAASIVNVGSIYAKFGPDWTLYEGTQMGNPAAYAASKAGLLQLTRWLATTLPASVRVNSVSPGGVLRGQSQEFLERYVKKVPAGRMATEIDVARTIAFLASPLSSYITGQDIAVDGGWGV